MIIGIMVVMGDSKSTQQHILLKREPSASKNTHTLELNQSVRLREKKDFSNFKIKDLRKLNNH